MRGTGLLLRRGLGSRLWASLLTAIVLLMSYHAVHYARPWILSSVHCIKFAVSPSFSPCFSNSLFLFLLYLTRIRNNNIFFFFSSLSSFGCLMLEEYFISYFIMIIFCVFFMLVMFTLRTKKVKQNLQVPTYLF
uniref:Uncharacterized protein n=1 Tax=Cacopsylla melanoneura TaxID=428564 RepID=A0A8D8Z564_9HEMI